MRRTLLLAALSGLSCISAQDIEFDLVDALPDPVYTTTLSTVIYNPTAVLEAAVVQITSTVDTTEASAAAVIEKRDTACQPQPAGSTSTPAGAGTADQFKQNAVFASAANGASTPNGYTNTFKNLQASNNAYGYMGYTTLRSYDTATCASKCNAIRGCMSFNIYFERDPSRNPAASCPNPAPVTNIKCVFWGGPVNQANAVNTGEARTSFKVVIAGSNGYQNNAIITPAGYNTAQVLGNAAINAPRDAFGADTYLGVAIFNSGPFDIKLCADACDMKSAYNIAHPPTDGSPVVTCNFFNTYILYVNDPSNVQGQYCAMYSESWDSSFATNKGQYRGNDQYLIQNSYSAGSNANPGAACRSCAVAQASKDIVYHTNQPYCSSLLGYTTPVTTSTSLTTTTPSTTVTATVTVNLRRRQASTVSTLIQDFPENVDSALSGKLEIAEANATPAPAIKRAAVPAADAPPPLDQYPSAVLTDACSLNANPVTSTSTSVVASTFTADTTTITATTTATGTPAPTCVNTPPLLMPAGDCDCRYNQICGVLLNAASNGRGEARLIAPVANAQDCAAQCDEFNNCFFYTFQVSTRTCRLYSNRRTPNINNNSPNADFVSGTFAGSCSDSTDDCPSL